MRAVVFFLFLTYATEIRRQSCMYLFPFGWLPYYHSTLALQYHICTPDEQLADFAVDF